MIKQLITLALFATLAACASPQPAQRVPRSVLWDDLNRPADLSKPFDWGIAAQRY